MRFVRGQPKPANGGRKKGVRNKRTVAAASRAAHPDALDHLAAVMAAKDDPTITPDLRLRAAIGLAAYQHPKPFPLKETFVGPIDYAAPKTVQEARAAILELGERMARREISVEAHDALINGIRTYLRRPNNGRARRARRVPCAAAIPHALATRVNRLKREYGRTTNASPPTASRKPNCDRRGQAESLYRIGQVAPVGIMGRPLSGGNK
jgi:hypothetical protein